MFSYCNRFIKSTDSGLFVKSELGTGKTAVMFAVAKQFLEVGHPRRYRNGKLLNYNIPGDLVVIMVNPNTISSWKREISKYGLVFNNRDPAGSDVIYYHSTVSVHFKYEMNVNNVIGKIIVCSKRIRVDTKFEKLLNLDTLVIHDEGHIVPTSGYTSFNNSKSLYFSGTRPVKNQIRYDKLIDIQNIIGGFNSNLRDKNSIQFKIPTIHLNFIELSTHNIDRNFEQICSEFKDKKYQKIIWFVNTPASQITAFIRRFKNNRSWKLFKFLNKSVKSYDQFAACKNPSILIVGYGVAMEGNNFLHADAVILSDFESRSSQASRQTIGRFRRPDTICKDIDVFLVKSPMSYINVCTAFDDKLTNWTKKDGKSIESIMNRLHSLNISIYDLSMNEIKFIFCRYPYPAPLTFNPDKFFEGKTLPLNTILELSLR